MGSDHKSRSFGAAFLTPPITSGLGPRFFVGKEFIMGQVSTGKTGLGVLLKMGDGESPEVFANVANVVSMEVGGITLELVDATHLDSPDFYREWLPSLKTAQAWSLTLQWDPSSGSQDGTTGLRKKAEDRLLTTFQVNPAAIGLSLGIEVDAYVTELGNISMTADGIMTQTCALQPTGKPREIAV